MSDVYSFRSYDRYLCLKPSVEMWLAILFFIRPIVLKISTIQMGRGPRTSSVSGLKEMVYPDDLGFFIALISTIPAVMVLIAYVRRRPGATELVRKIWHHGAGLLIFTGVLNVGIVFVPLLTNPGQKWIELGWMQLVISVIIMVYLATSQRVRDTFSDFPGNDSGED